jgi:hypothetical protein
MRKLSGYWKAAASRGTRQPDGGFSGIAAARLEDDEDARGCGMERELEESSQATEVIPRARDHRGA